MLLFKDKINYKLARGNGFPAHLDAPAYDHIGRIDHITANFAIDPATLENGCLDVVPGSHKMEVPCIDGGGRIDPNWEAKQNWVSVPLEAGDVLIFGSRFAHRSAENKTDKARASLYATFHMKKDGLDLRQRYYKHRRANFPPDHGKYIPICCSGIILMYYLEREEGNDYAEGFKTYGFAAPFISKSADKAVPVIAGQS